MPTPYTPQENRDLDERIIALAGDCNHVTDSFFRSDLTQEEALPRFRRYKLVAKSCVDFLVELQRRNDSCALMIREAPSKHWRDIEQTIIPFAMSIESEHFTDLSKWLGSTWISLRPQVLVPEPMLHATKGLADKLNSYYGWLEPDGYRMPAFYSAGQFRDIHLHMRALPSMVNEAMADIVSTSRHDPHATLEWIKKIHTCYVKEPATGQKIKSSLADTLAKVPVEGLDDLRDYILGQAPAKASECSVRCERMLSNIIQGIPSYDLESDAFVLASNPRYMKNAFVAEFVDLAQKYHYQFIESDDEDPFHTGIKCANDLIRLFGIAGLDTDDLCRIAMKMVGNFSLGAILDLEEEEPAKRLTASFNGMNGYNCEELDMHSNLRDAILSSVVRSLPDDLVMALANDSDNNRAQIYTITGNSAHLAGMKDPKRLDAVMGSDLGL